MSNKVYSIITEKIIKLLEGGSIPWNKPWLGGANGMPKNYVSKKPYRGVNTWLLAFEDFTSPYWLTFKQANELGAKVKKGSKGTMIVFYKMLESKTKTDKTGNPEKFPMLRYYVVFNADQVEGLPSDAYGDIKGNLDFKPIEACEKIIEGYRTKPEIKHEKNQAYYVPSLDYVNMPKKENFKSIAEYYSTLFHELTHSTGHKSRLDRNLDDIGAFGDEVYSKEELIAEFGASFLCGIAGIENNTIRNSAGYLQGWLNKLRTDDKLLIASANKAQKAVDYILGINAGTKDKKEVVAVA